mmetsp:Transcript_53696/g.148928  ORF Transcript_53696/g.148928 Transcript_53696/m.148928 type:complete len:209 (+) Transcript_53696:598-1224(+)
MPPRIRTPNHVLQYSCQPLLFTRNIHRETEVSSRAAKADIQRSIIDARTSHPHSAAHILCRYSWCSRTQLTSSLTTCGVSSSCCSRTSSFEVAVLIELMVLAGLFGVAGTPAMMMRRRFSCKPASEYSSQPSSFSLHRISMRMPQKGKIRTIAMRVTQKATRPQCSASTQSGQTASVIGKNGSENWMVFRPKGQISASTSKSVSMRPT